MGIGHRHGRLIEFSTTSGQVFRQGSAFQKGEGRLGMEFDVRAIDSPFILLLCQI